MMHELVTAFFIVFIYLTNYDEFKVYDSSTLIIDNNVNITDVVGSTIGVLTEYPTTTAADDIATSDIITTTVSSMTTTEFYPSDADVVNISCNALKLVDVLYDTIRWYQVRKDAAAHILLSYSSNPSESSYFHYPGRYNITSDDSLMIIKPNKTECGIYRCERWPASNGQVQKADVIYRIEQCKDDVFTYDSDIPKDVVVPFEINDGGFSSEDYILDVFMISCVCVGVLSLAGIILAYFYIRNKVKRDQKCEEKECLI
ncbi:hypothetical protein nvc1_111 [Namao virus]|nr:hypothetical protein nvc1_111 [Namao virus]